MCHEWWVRRRWEEREESSRLWDEFERTRPLSDPSVPEEEPEVTLEAPERTLETPEPTMRGANR